MVQLFFFLVHKHICDRICDKGDNQKKLNSYFIGGSNNAISKKQNEL